MESRPDLIKGGTRNQSAISSQPCESQYCGVPKDCLNLLCTVLKPEEYADVISSHARLGMQDSLYPGLNFANLASFLQQPFKNTRHLQYNTNVERKKGSFAFTRRYVYGILGQESFSSFEHPNQLWKASLSSTQNDKSHTILFLRGVPSGLWLAVIGGIYCVDPEFFQRHLDFWSSVGKVDYFSLPSLPSTSERMIELTYISLGRTEGSGRNPTNVELEATRRASLKSLNRYTHDLITNMEHATAVGDSVIRGFHLLDETHFAIEQRISIYLSNSGHSRTSKSAFEKCCRMMITDGVHRSSLAGFW